MPVRADRLRRRPGDHGRQRRRGAAVRRRHPPLRCQPLDARALLLRRRRRAVDRPAARRAATGHRIRHARRRPGRDRAHSARRALPGRCSSTPRRAATSARTTARPLRLPELGPIGANGLANARDFLAPESPRSRSAKAPSNSSRSSPAGCGARRIDHSPLDVVAWHGNHAPYKYDLRALQRDQQRELRPSRSVDLHGADVAVGHARDGERSTSSSFRRAGWSPSTRSGRRGSIAT